MKTIHTLNLIKLAAASLLLSILNPLLPAACAQGTAFTYQGKLASGGDAANGVYDFTFTAWNASSGGAQQGAAFATNAVPVTNGYFVATLDVGNVFNGEARWLQIAVRTNGASSFTPLTPRQQLTPAPLAIFAGTASTLSGTLSTAQLTGAIPASQLSGTLGNGQLANSSVTVNAGTGLSGGGAVALGGTATLNNTGLLSISGNSDITASTVNGAVTLGDTATSSNTASTIVKRDASGNFSAGSVTFTGNLNLPTPAVIYSENTVLLRSDGSLNQNFFAGWGAGKSTTATANVGLGFMALFNNTIGYYNTAIGVDALQANTTGVANTANGILALGNNTTGSQNTAQGFQALPSNTNGDYNTAVGDRALHSNSGGHHNIALGSVAGYYITNSNNIDIGNTGIATDANTIRIGTPETHTNTFIAGVINGNGGGLTNVTATSLSGTLPSAQLYGTYSGVLNFNNPANLFSGNGSGLTSLNALELTSGTVADARLSGNVALLNNSQSFTGAKTFGNAGNSFTGNGSGLTGLNASQLGSGTVADARLSGNVAMLNNVQTFTGQKTFNNPANSYIGDVTATGLRMNSCTNSGPSSVALGYTSTASAQDSTALGYNTTASGTYSTAMGVQTYATGWGSTAIGQGSVASGADSTTLGNGTFATADYSTAMGQFSRATNFCATAMGSNTLAAGAVSLATGNRTRATGQFSTAMGNQTTASGFSSFALGSQSTASGYTSFVAGNNVFASGWGSFALGVYANAANDNCFIWGDGTDLSLATTAPNQFVIGASGGVRVTAGIRMGPETGTTSEGPGYPASSTGLVVRRVQSTAFTLNQIVAAARNDANSANITLERDGTHGGFLIRYPAHPGRLTIACMGMDSTGAARNFYTSLADPGTAGTVPVYSDAQAIVHFECTFGITYAAARHLTQVTLTRDNGDYYWSGTLNSTYNQ